MTYHRPPAKKKAKAAHEIVNEKHPELVCAEAGCPWNKQTETRRRTRVWVFLHQLSHGRGTFSAATLADLAGCSLTEAEVAIRAAVDWNMVMQVAHAGTAEVYAKHAKPKGSAKKPSAAVRSAAAFGKAASAGTLWGA